jgi:hypothetical protein
MAIVDETETYAPHGTAPHGTAPHGTATQRNMA